MEIWFWIGLIFAAGVGMACGSYATMPYYRLPNNIACAGRWVGKRSACPACGVQLRTRDLLPVFNWLGTGGKCFKCSVEISYVYFFIEAGCMLASIALYLRFGFDQLYILGMGLATCAMIQCAMDYSYRTMHDRIFVVMAMLGMIYRALLDGQIYDMIFSFSLAVLIALLAAQLYEQRMGKTVQSYRYLKWLALTGLWFTVPEFIVFLLVLAVAFGGIVALSRTAGLPATPYYSLAFFFAHIVVLMNYTDILAMF